MNIVTLTTDIGQQDYFVGAIKGQLLSLNPNLTIVDITHYLTHSNFPEAAYICKNAFKEFPEKTIHIIILNFFENKSDNLLLAEYKGQYIICADNGILTMLSNNLPIKIYAIPINHADNFLAHTKKIATIIKDVTSGIPIEKIATPTTSYITKNSLRPTIFKDSIKGLIIFIDNFENVVTNITKEDFDSVHKGRKFKIEFARGEGVEVISTNYLSVHEGEKLAWFNSAGHLELAINKGNLAGLFGLEGFNEINYQQGKSMQNKIFYTPLLINFEPSGL